MDVMKEYFNLGLSGEKLKPGIFGKKRPCYTCHARLDGMALQIAEEVSLNYQPFEFNTNKPR